MTRTVPEPEQAPTMQDAPPVSPEAARSQALDLASMVGMGSGNDFRTAVVAMRGQAGRGDALLPPVQVGNPNGDGAAPAIEAPAVPGGARGARVLAPSGDGPHPQAQIHAPELAGARVDTTATDGNTLMRAYTNGYQLFQHLRGPLAGSEVLTDGNGRVIRQLEASHAEGHGRSRLEIEYTYGQPQDGPWPTAVTLRNATTGQVEGRRTNEDGQIVPHREGYQYTSNDGNHTDMWHINGTQSRQYNGQFAESSLQFIAQAEIRTPEGHVFPAGSLVSHHTSKGETGTTVTSADGRTQQTFSRIGNGNMFQTGENYSQPRAVQHNINGTNQTFENITAQYFDRNTGNLYLHGNGHFWTLTSRNGQLVDATKTLSDKPMGGGISVPDQPLLNSRQQNNIAIADKP